MGAEVLPNYPSDRPGDDGGRGQAGHRDRRDGPQRGSGGPGLTAVCARARRPRSWPRSSGSNARSPRSSQSPARRDPRPLVAGCAGALAAVDLGPDHPIPQRLRVDPHLFADPRQHLARIAGSRRASPAIRVARSRSSSGYFLGVAVLLILWLDESLHQSRGETVRGGCGSRTSRTAARSPAGPPKGPWRRRSRSAVATVSSTANHSTGASCRVRARNPVGPRHPGG